MLFIRVLIQPKLLFYKFAYTYKFNHMARVTLGSGITSINGSIGGTTYQSGASGTIAKNKGKRVRRVSASSGRVSQLITYIQQTWSNLSQSDRDQWQAYSIYKPVPQKHNSGRFLTGQQIFFLYNYSYYYQFGSLVTTPIFDTSLNEERTFTIHFDSGTLYLRSSSTIDETYEFLMFKISAQVKPSRKVSVGGVKQIKCVFSGSTEQNLTGSYEQLFGACPIIGSYVEIEIQQFRTDCPNFTNKYKKIAYVSPY